MARAAKARTLLAAIASAAFLAQPAIAQDRPLDRGEASALWSVLERAGDHGLAVRDLPDILLGLSSRGEQERREAQAALRQRAVAYSAAQHGGRIDPLLMPDEWAIRPPFYDAQAAFAEARAQGKLWEWASALPPRTPQYASLLERRAAYVGISAEGGWAPIAPMRALRQGDSDQQVLSLRGRLAIEGYSAVPEEAAELFDAALSAALARYQGDRSLDVDGVLGPATVAELNAPVEAVLHRIDLNLERLRWLPRDLPATRLDVNVPAMELVYVEDGVDVLRMRTIVGARFNRTPMLQTAIEAVIFNPVWVVPDSIARREILPSAAADPTYLERNGYTLTDGRLRQSPGPDNALGQIKFDSPNAFGVYMHDTPARGLFARPMRALSHGCVRLELPRDLAAALLRNDGWMIEGIDAAIAEGTTERVPLRSPVPVFFRYQTAVVEEGRLRLLSDPYQWDTALDRLLSGAGAAAARTPSAASTCSAAFPKPLPSRK